MGQPVRWRMSPCLSIIMRGLGCSLIDSCIGIEVHLQCATGGQGQWQAAAIVVEELW